MTSPLETPGKTSRKTSCKTLVDPAAALVLCCALGAASDAGAAPIERFRTSNDTYQRFLETLDTLFPEDLLVPGLRGSVGLGLAYTPKYLGSDEYNFTVVPLLRLNYRNYISLSGTTLRVNAIGNERWTVGVLAKYVTGRGNAQSGVLGGLEDIDSTVALGPYVEYRLGRFQFGAEWRHALGGGQGDELKLTVSSGLYQSADKRFGLQGAVSTSIASGEFMRTNFGVTPAESATSVSGFVPYRPGGGLYEIAVSLGGQYKITDNWNFGQFIELDRLTGGADESPLVRIGSPWQISGGVGVYYKF